MLAIYRLVVPGVSVLVLMQYASASLAQEATSLGSTAGMSDVQQRMESGAESEVEKKRVHSAAVDNAANQLSNTVRRFETEHPEWRAESDIHQSIQQAADREFVLHETAPDSLAQALRCVANALSSGSSITRARYRLVNELLHQLADPMEFPVRHSAGRAVFQTLLYKQPDKFIEQILGNARPDESESAAIADRLAGAARNTTELQQLYDRLSGTQKPLTILKNDREFLLIQRSGKFELFADDTQFLELQMRLNNAPIEYMIRSDGGYTAELHARNSSLPVAVAQQLILTGSEVVVRTTLRNLSRSKQTVDFSIDYSSQFKDMFEVRGWVRKKRGSVLAPLVDPVHSTVTLRYQALDGKREQCVVRVDPRLSFRAGGSRATAHITLLPQNMRQIETIVSPGELSRVIPFAQAKAVADSQWKSWASQGARVESDNPALNKLLNRGERDIYMLKQRTIGGTAIAAGLPWFAAPFGRDQLITAIEMLPYRPELAREVLLLLARYQGAKTDRVEGTEERPGKIMHELRVGEMARLKEIPFRPYYGTVDATPLWLMLCSMYLDATADVGTIRKLKPNIDRAVAFLQEETKTDHYLHYGGMTKAALSNQGWKDSGDSVMHSDGRLADPPIALCEVQGYLYNALSAAARLNELLGEQEVANRLNTQRSRLRTKFNNDFWSKDQSVIPIAIDGRGEPAAVLSSNAGQVLMSDLLDRDKARVLSRRLFEKDMFSGFGIRTLSTNEKRYFPNSYHNGSVWPHDSALVAYGVARFNRPGAVRITEGLLDASRFQTNARLPELFGGYSKSQVPIPVPYPVACEPQAWSSAAPFMLMTACLGLHPDAPHNRLIVDHPTLPGAVNRLTVRRLRIGQQSADLLFQRKGTLVEVVTLKPTKLNISVRK